MENEEKINSEEQENKEAQENMSEEEAKAEATEEAGETAAEGGEAKSEDEPEKSAAEIMAEFVEKSQKMKDDYLRLYADFENYKKRTLKEKSEILQTAGKTIMLDILPLVDDFERGMAAMENTTDAESVKKGISLIYNKFVKFLENHNMKAIETEGKDFDTDFHEAIATIPAGDDKKNKIIDCTQKGYVLNDVVVRYAKVVIGQ